MITFQKGPFRRSFRVKLKTTEKVRNEKHYSETNLRFKNQRLTNFTGSSAPFTSSLEQQGYSMKIWLCLAIEQIL